MKVQVPGYSHAHTLSQYIELTIERGTAQRGMAERANGKAAVIAGILGRLFETLDLTTHELKTILGTYDGDVFIPEDKT